MFIEMSATFQNYLNMELRIVIQLCKDHDASLFPFLAKESWFLGLEDPPGTSQLCEAFWIREGSKITPPSSSIRRTEKRGKTGHLIPFPLFSAASQTCIGISPHGSCDLGDLVSWVRKVGEGDKGNILIHQHVWWPITGSNPTFSIREHLRNLF